MNTMKPFILLMLLCLVAWVPSSIADESNTVKVGDLIQINLPGEASLNQGFQVDRRGRINLPEVGPVLVAGYNEQQLQDVIIDRLKTVYRDVNNARVFIKQQQLLVSVQGYVSNPVNIPYLLGPTFKCLCTKLAAARRGSAR
ncbi:periplasmic protein SypC [Vibrio sp. JCM 19053]|nr:periplasmic protein SypC [Vibrio sp. JCM 19053]